jgi:aspartyl-tRNA synthetase
MNSVLRIITCWIFWALKRTHYCGALRVYRTRGQPPFCSVGSAARDLGNLLFLDVRDHAGIMGGV